MKIYTEKRKDKYELFSSLRRHYPDQVIRV